MTEQIKEEILEENEAAEEMNKQEAPAETTEEDDEVSEYNDTAAQIDDLEEKLEEANEKYVRLFAEYDNFFYTEIRQHFFNLCADHFNTDFYVCTFRCCTCLDCHIQMVYRRQQFFDEWLQCKLRQLLFFALYFSAICI